MARYTQAIFFFPHDNIGSSGSGHLRHLKHQSSALKDVSGLPPNKITWLFQDNQSVIHPTTNATIGTIQFQFHRKLILDQTYDEDSPVMEWKIYAEGMDPQKGQVNIFSFFRLE